MSHESFRADYDMNAPLGARARPTEVRAAIDPGYEIGITIATGDAPPLRLVCPPMVVSVGRVTEHDPPILKRNSVGKEYLSHSTRIVDVEDRDIAVQAVIDILIAHGVMSLTIENVENPYFGRRSTPQGAAKQGRDHGKTGKITEAIRVRALALGIKVTLVVRATWVARLRPLIEAAAETLPVAADGEAEPTKLGRQAVTGKGLQLVPVLRRGLLGWPNEARGACNEHTRDAGGMLLWAVLPPLERRSRRKRADDTKRRSPRTGPKGRRVRTAAYHDANKARRRASWAAAGCTCGPSRTRRHYRACPMHKGLAWAVDTSALTRARAAAGCGCKSAHHKVTCHLSPRYNECSCSPGALWHGSLCPRSPAYSDAIPPTWRPGEKIA